MKNEENGKGNGKEMITLTTNGKLPTHRSDRSVSFSGLSRIIVDCSLFE